MKKIKVLVLGSNGFIGKNVVERFVYMDKYEVLAPKRLELNLLDSCSVEQYLKSKKPDVVVHSAVNVNSVEENIQMYFNVRRCSGFFGKLISIGSGAEYDMRSYRPLMPESYFGVHTPADIYGVSKFVVSSDIENSAINAVNLRLFGVFGKYEDYRRRFISNNICRALCGMGISINQNMMFDYICIDDFIDILVFFLEKDGAFKSYNICGGAPVSLIDLAGLIRDAHGDNGISIDVHRDGMRQEYSGSNERFQSEFGPFVFRDMKSVINDLYGWYKGVVDCGICDKIR